MGKQKMETAGIFNILGFKAETQRCLEPVNLFFFGLPSVGFLLHHHRPSLNPVKVSGQLSPPKCRDPPASLAWRPCPEGMMGNDEPIVGTNIGTRAAGVIPTFNQQLWIFTRPTLSLPYSARKKN